MIWKKGCLLAILTSALVLFLAADTTATTPSAPSTLQSVDPYRHFKFQVRIDGRAVAGFATLAFTGPLGSAVLLQRGVSHDTQFAAWAAQWTRSLTDAQRMSAKRKDVMVDVFNEAGQVSASHSLKSCAVSEFQAVPDLDAGAHAVAIAVVKFICQGRSAPSAPTYNAPR